MKLQRLIILLISVLFLNLSLFGQKSCLNTLREARELYEQGLIDDIPNMLSECMESGFTRGQRVEAYKLIILSYLFDDDQFAAEKAMDEFLKKFPEYEVMPNDPVEFVYLLESYKTSSFYSINLTFGPTFTNPVILEQYSLLDVSNTDFNDKTGTGFQLGLGISRNLFKSVNANIGLFYSTYNYSFNETSRIQLADKLYTFAETRAEEKIDRIELPLSMTYYFGRGNLHYTARLGFSVGYITSAKLSVNRTQTGLINDISSNFDIREYRKALDYAVIFGGGMEYKVPRGYLVLDLRYRLGLSEVPISDLRNANSRLNTSYFHLDDDFRLNSFSMAIGYHFSIYQSRKDRF
ncbi:MAG: PorT family protein [Bacteroidales bacterium]|nr:PorT family protein [Bacteroidales bacterium]